MAASGGDSSNELRKLFPEEKRGEMAEWVNQSAVANVIDYAKFRSRSHDAVLRVYDDAGNVIETHEHAGDFKEP